MKTISTETQLDEWIATALNGELNGPERKEFDDYLAAHPEARQAYEETQTMNRLLEKTLKKDQPDPGFEDRMVNRFRRGQRSQDLGFWKHWSSLWKGQKTVYAGALAALVLSFYIGGGVEDRKTISETENLFGSSSTGEASTSRIQKALVEAAAGYGPTTNSNWNESAGKDSESDFQRLAGANTYTGDATIAAGELEINNGAALNQAVAVNGDNFVETSKKGVVLSGYVDQGYVYGAQGGRHADDAAVAGQTAANGDFNLNAVKIANGTLDSAAAKLQQGFKANVMLGEDKSRIEQSNENGKSVPGLGDIPVMGRLFATHADQEKQAAQKNNNVPPTKPEPFGVSGLPPADNKPGDKALKEWAITPANSPETPAPDQVQRKLVRNANIGLEVKSYAAALRDLTQLTQEEKGFVATQNDRTQANGHTAGQVVIKLPPDRLDGFVLRLRDLGNIQHQILKTDDVTKAYFDTEARLRNAKKTEERLLELMAKKTDKVADLLQVEKEIGRVRESIEQMQGELKLMDSLASLATVTIDLVEQDMDQAAAYLLKETANLSLYSADVEKSYKQAREWAEKSEAQIVTAQMNRNSGGQMNATLSLLAAPDRAFALIEQLKTLGRVQSFDQDTQRVAQDGRSGMAGTTRRDKVEIRVSIVPDDASRKTVTLQVVTPDVEKALDQAKKAALAGSGEVLASTLQRNPNGHSQAVLTVRLPSKKVEETKAVFAGQGRVVQMTVQRNDEAGTNVEGEDSAPVILALTLSDEEPPVQVTRLNVEGEKVAAKVEELKTRARGQGIEIRTSSFSRSPDGVEQAVLVFRMMQKDYPSMVETLQGTGKTLKLTLDRRDRIDAVNTDAGSEPVEVLFVLKSPSPIIASENGFMGAVRHTLEKSFNVLFNSLQRMVMGFAYLLPWLLTGGIGLLIWKKWRRNKAEK